MAKINTLNYQTVASWNGSQDLFVVEQPDGTKVATPAQIKQYVLGNSIDDIYSVMGQNGAKNLIPYPYVSNSYSQRGINFTCLSDGTINANGTNDGTGNSTYSFVRFTLSKGSYVLNGCPMQTGNNYRCGLIRVSDGTTLVSDYGNGANLTLDTDTDVRAFVQVMNGKTADNITFKPMIRLAADTDDTYQPYAKTNRQLTEAIGDLSQTGLTGDSVADQLTTAKGQITGKAEKNPSAFSDYTDQRLYAAAAGMTLTDIKGGYKVKDGICYVFMQVSFTGSFGTPGAWNFIGGFPASAVDGIPIIAVPTNNDTNTVALRGGRMNTTGSLFIINESTLTGDNSTAFTFIGSYPVANP